MEKPATPGHGPDARFDVETDGCIPDRPGSGTPGSGRWDVRGIGPGWPGDESHLHDAWLVEHARHGDHQAFAVLVRRYERKLIRVLMRLVHEPEQARDLAQETFWRVYTRLDRFDTARRFGPWLFRVGVNLALDWLRSTRRRRRRPPRSIGPTPTARRSSSCPTRTLGSGPTWRRKFTTSWD